MTGIKVHGICIQCALREFVAQLEAGLDPMVQPATGAGEFEGDPDEHTRLVHGGFMKAREERADLERRAEVAFERLKQLARTRAENARNN